MSSFTPLRSALALTIATLLTGVSVASAQAPAAKPKAPKKPASVATQSKEPAPVPAPPPAPPTDVKIHTKYVNGPQVSENTTYMKGVRQRVEFPGVTVINQCDLTRSVQLHDATKHFMVVPADSPAAQMPGPPAGPATASQAAATPASSTPSGQSPVAPKPQGGVITETVTLTDTGERKQMFGLEARHITTLIVRQPGPNACDSRTTTIETDGWYADLPERPACPSTPVSTPPPPPASDACIDRVETRQVGDARMGVALSTTITTAVNDAPRGSDGHSPDSPDHAGNGNRATVSMSVTDLEITTLAAALFDVPPGYTEVKSYQELLPSLASGGSLADAVFGSLADGTSMVAPKKPGITRIGIVDPTKVTRTALQNASSIRATRAAERCPLPCSVAR